MTKRNLNYNQVCNHLLSGLYTYALFKGISDPRLILVKGKVVAEQDKNSFGCTCGCKEQKNWSVHEN